jgi:hypothetical protein
MVTGSWSKSSFSNPSGNCVEVKIGNHGKVLVRDSKDNGDGPELSFSLDDWALLIQEIKDGFAVPMGGKIETWAGNGIVTMLHRDHTRVRLSFTQSEWNAFVEGVHHGHFDLQPA